MATAWLVLAGPLGPVLSPAPSATPSVGVVASPTALPTASAFPTATPAPSAAPSSPEPPIDTSTPEPCGTFDPRCSRLPVNGGWTAIARDLPCGDVGTCTLGATVLYPRTGGPWPVIVAVGGGPAPPEQSASMGEFSRLVASQGAVVFAVDYRAGPEWGGGYPVTYEDIACAIRVARADAAEWSGDPSRVTLAAHSFGPFVASVAALSDEGFDPAPGACVETDGSTRPDAFIGIAGIYSQDGITETYLTSFFGGPRDAVPDRWAAGDPYALVAAGRNSGLPVRLINGAQDANVQPASSEAFHEALHAAGYDSKLAIIEGAGHSSVLQDHRTIEIVMRTALGLE